MPIESSLSPKYEALVLMVWPLSSSLPILTILAFFIRSILPPPTFVGAGLPLRRQGSQSPPRCHSRESGNPYSSFLFSAFSALSAVNLFLITPILISAPAANKKKAIPVIPSTRACPACPAKPYRFGRSGERSRRVERIILRVIPRRNTKKKRGLSQCTSG